MPGGPAARLQLEEESRTLRMAVPTERGAWCFDDILALALVYPLLNVLL